LVSEAVRTVGASYSAERLTAEVERLAPAILGRTLTTKVEELQNALDADHFVRVRTVVGGPAPQTVKVQIDSALREQEQCSAWLGEKRQLLQRYREMIRDAASSLS
jgi:argininosuccinate lyase